MAKYVLAYDKFENGEDPFENIVQILHEKGATDIQSVLESTFVFDWKQNVCEYELYSIIKEQLNELCFYCLGECCTFINSKENDIAKPSREERIERIINNHRK